MAKSSDPSNRKKRSILRVDVYDIAVACDAIKEKGFGSERQDRACIILFTPKAIEQELWRHLPTFRPETKRVRNYDPYLSEADVRAVFEFLNVKDCYIRVRYTKPKQFNFPDNSEQRT